MRGSMGLCFELLLNVLLMQTPRWKHNLGSHTFRTHGTTVARTHMHDWLILILLIAIDVILNIIHPFYRFVGRDMMNDLKFPLKSNTVPMWVVPIYTVFLPMVIFLIFYVRRRDVYDLHHAILGLLFSVLVTAVITDAIKDVVGQPRPDFFWRCFPDGKDSGRLLAPLAGCFRWRSHRLIVATFCYLQFFPPPYYSQGWGLYAYFRVLEESLANTRASDAANIRNVQLGAARIEPQQDDRNIGGVVANGVPHQQAVEDLEAGRR